MKLGIIGAGKIVNEFLAVVDQIDGFEFTAIYGRKSSQEKMKAFQAEYPIKNIYLDYETIIESQADTFYIALPNNLHFDYAKRALEAGKHVIVEKPMTSTFEEASVLAKIAKEKKLFLFEAITNQYAPNYLKIKELLPQLGTIKIVDCNFSQYSSRYDSFRAGEVLPAFDPEYAGGALMDINIYNIHYVTGLFGRPKAVKYYPNIEAGIDTSGILILSYDSFQCVCIGTKDSQAPAAIRIQGIDGSIYQPTPANICGGFELNINNQEKKEYEDNGSYHRMHYEFEQIAEMMRSQNFEKCYTILEHSLLVSEIATRARRESGIIFPQDH